MKYLIIGLLIYWIAQRVMRISYAAKHNGKPPLPKNPQKPQQTKVSPPKKDNHGGDYVDFEEVD